MDLGGSRQARFRDKQSATNNLTRRANHLQNPIITQSVNRKRTGTGVGVAGPHGVVVRWG
jgi:hypothetical protein